jgi:hypothetical protein
MIGYIILGSIIAILVIIILIRIIFSQKQEIERDETEIKFDEHIIKAMNEAIIEDGKITREANEQRNENDKSDSTVDIVNSFNKL